MKTSWRSASLVATAAAMLALTTACGQEQGTQSTVGQNVGATAAAGDYGLSSPSAAGVGAQAATQAKSAGALAVAKDAKLGEVITDSAGLTLYRFDKDTAEPPKTTCEGDCATAWPPVPADGATAATGVDAALLGEVTRPDGTKQLTVGGWPMYRYAKDKKAGDTLGQAVGGTWFASSPEGKKATLADLPGLSTRKDAKLGEIVVDKNGLTVYRFTKDTAWPDSISACTGACLEKWPAVAPVEEPDVKGLDIDSDGLMPFTRSDGIKQMALDCWPIYTFSGDEAPGDTNGQGVGGTWYAVSPEGKLVGAPKQ
ncbi:MULTISPECIES: SCO0930 family lipoprotein [unclassified Streptomyces]|uniref:SCO0930 family lipoprotein n=1 Tax=unclassified Streptomyces TaxID=2593676 RepID=UPI003662ED7E